MPTLKTPSRWPCSCWSPASAARSPRGGTSGPRGEQRKVEAVIESIDDGLVVLDGEGTILHMNDVACAILGVERAAAHGRRYDALGTSHSHYLRLRETIRDLLRQPDRPPQPIELASFLRGRDHFYLLQHAPLRTPGAASGGLILVLQDVTQLRDQAARREELMATLSHELRTPLTSLRMAGELLARSEPPLAPAAAAVVATVREDVTRLEELAERLLDLSRSRATAIALDANRWWWRRVRTHPPRLRCKRRSMA
jgi:NtrC-family two-component system sensor histidine kinase KinB